MTDLKKLIKPGTNTQDNRTFEDTEGGGDTAPPTMLEVLGEHLYRKLEEVQEGYGTDLDVARVTGILLELGEQQVLRLLQDRQMLQQSVKKVIQHVPDVCLHTSDAGSSLKEGEDLESGQLDEERLYEQVCQLEPELSPHITGMLLELGRSRVKSLLRSPASLRRAVTHAKTAYVSQHSGSSSSPASLNNVDVKPVDESPKCRVNSSIDDHTTAVNNSKQSCLAEKVTQSIARSMVGQDGWQGSGVGLRAGMAGQTVHKCDWVLGDDDDVTEEEVGDVVYTEAERLYPQSAEKLTGMILDMGADQVRQYLHNKDRLHRAIHVAFTSLSGTNSQR